MTSEGKDMTQETEPLDAAGIAEELRGFAEGSTSARASLMRDAANVIDSLRIELLGWELGHGDRLLARRDAAVKEMEARELHHFEVEEENARLWSIIAKAAEGSPS